MKMVLDFVGLLLFEVTVQYILSVFAFASVYQLHYLHHQSCCGYNTKHSLVKHREVVN